MRPALLLVLFLAACPRPRAGTTVRGDTPGAKPGADLAAADDAPGTVTGKDDATGEPIIEAKTPGPLLDAGNKAFNEGKLDEAEGWYRKLATDFPDSELAPAALYNIALVREKQGSLDQAVSAYLELAKAYPKAPETIDAELRAAAILADKEQWPRAIEVLDLLLARDDLEREVRIEGFARKGFVQLEQGALDDAERTLGEAVTTWKRASRIEDPYYIAMAHFYLGEVEARRFDKQPVRSADEALSADMRTKREILLRAYAHWKEALQFKQAYWATAAGYQMSQIFYDYWIAAVKAPFPDGMTVDARPDYVKEVHERVRENLVKALDGHRANVELAEAFGVETTWSQTSKARAADILAILDREARGEAVVP